MESAVGEPPPMGDIQPLGELHDERQDGFGGGGRAVTHRDVERIRRDVLVGEIRHPVGDAGAHGIHQRRVRNPDADDLRERVAEEDRLLGGQIDVKGLEREHPVAIRRVAIRQARTVHGTEDATPNLVHRIVGTEYTGSVIRAGTTECQGERSSKVQAARYQEVHGFSMR